MEQASERTKEKKNEREKKCANEQHYFWLSEKQSHHGSLRLREAAAVAAVAENMLHDTHSQSRNIQNAMNSLAGWFFAAGAAAAQVLS